MIQSERFDTWPKAAVTDDCQPQLILALNRTSECREQYFYPLVKLQTADEEHDPFVERHSPTRSGGCPYGFSVHCTKSADGADVHRHLRDRDTILPYAESRQVTGLSRAPWKKTRRQ